jgi:hypothetical protein
MSFEAALIITLSWVCICLAGLFALAIRICEEDGATIRDLKADNAKWMRRCRNAEQDFADWFEGRPAPLRAVESEPIHDGVVLDLCAGKLRRDEHGKFGGAS